MKPYIDIEYTIGGKYKIKSNIKNKCILDLLWDFIERQLGKGSDGKEPIKRDVYHIRIRVDLNDIFVFKSDTGSNALTLGIIMDVADRIGGKEAKRSKNG
jgi:hypothetical protein